MDYEEVGNVTHDGDITSEESGRYIAHEIVFTIVCLVAICADAFIIYIIFRYKRMRTAPNIILANWAIADLCFLILTPSAYRIVSVIEHIPISFEFWCFLTHVGTMLHFTNLVFTLIVAIDWCLAAHFEKLSEKFRYYYKFVIVAIWVCFLLSGSITTGLCISGDGYFWYSDQHVISLIVAYSVIFLVIIVLQCQRAIQKCRRRLLDYPPLMLNVVSSCALCWFLGFIGLFLMGITGVFHHMLAIIGIISVFCTSIVTFTIMCRYNKDFQACFLQTLRRKEINYEEADFVFHNPIRKPIVKQSAQISFNKSQELLTNVYCDTNY